MEEVDRICAVKETFRQALNVLPFHVIPFRHYAIYKLPLKL